MVSVTVYVLSMVFMAVFFLAYVGFNWFIANQYAKVNRKTSERKLEEMYAAATDADKVADDNWVDEFYAIATGPKPEAVKPDATEPPLLVPLASRLTFKRVGAAYEVSVCEGDTVTLLGQVYQEDHRWYINGNTEAFKTRKAAVAYLAGE